MWIWAYYVNGWVLYMLVSFSLGQSRILVFIESEMENEIFSPLKLLNDRTVKMYLKDYLIFDHEMLRVWISAIIVLYISFIWTLCSSRNSNWFFKTISCWVYCTCLLCKSYCRRKVPLLQFWRGSIRIRVWGWETLLKESLLFFPV